MKQFFLLLPILAFSSCCFFNAAKQPLVDIHSVDVHGVTDVHVSGNIILNITQTAESKLEIKASDTVLAQLSVEAQGSKLEIKDKYKPVHDPVIVTLAIPELQSIGASGAIKGQIDNIKTPTFTLMGSGSIDVALSGATDHLNISVSGSIQIDATSLLSNSIDAQGAGSGRIMYQGNPIIKKSLSESIHLIKEI